MNKKGGVNSLTRCNLFCHPRARVDWIAAHCSAVRVTVVADVPEEGREEPCGPTGRGPLDGGAPDALAEFS